MTSMIALLGMVVRPLPAQTEQNGSAAAAEEESGPVIAEYNDIRNGFSLRCPWAARPYCNTTASLQKQALDHINGHYIPHQAFRDFMNWQTVKLPAAKELVRFFPEEDPDRGCLMVFLLVTKDPMNIDELMQARKSYWHKYPQRAVIQDASTTLINGRATARLDLAWSKDKASPPSQYISESLIQNEKERFYMIMLSANVKQSPDPCRVGDLLDQTLQTFSCLSTEEENRRWEQAKKNGEALLARQTGETVKGHLNGEYGYRVIVQKQEVGFVHVSEHFSKEGQAAGLDVRLKGYITRTPQALDVAAILGMSTAFNTAANDNPAPSGPVQIEADLHLDPSLKTGRFHYRIYPVSSREHGYAEEGQITNGSLELKRFAPAGTEKPATENLKINNAIYLPWSLRLMLHRLTSRTIDREYVFMTYHDRNLCYYTLRYTAEMPVEIDGVVGNTVYALGQPGVQGPLIEYWLDEAGGVVKQSCAGVTLIRAKSQRLKKKWPDQFKPVATPNAP